MKKFNLTTFFIAILFLLTLASASNFNFSKDYTLNNQYSSGDLISGTFQMNFSNQANAYFSSNLGDKISLLDFLNKSSYNSGSDFYCFPSSCQKSYSTSNSASSKSFNLIDKNLIGLVINNKANVEITGLNLTINSSADASCYNQLSIDLFDDNSTELYNNNYIDEPCFSKMSGCFDSNSDLTNVNLGSTPYCEKIALPAAPAYRIGATVYNGTEKADITMNLYNFDSGEELGNCKLPDFSQSPENLDCIINYSVKSNFSALVCISSEGSDYGIRSESDDPVCGFEGTDTSQNFQADYEIYAQPLKYDKFNRQLNSNYFEELTGNDLVTELQNYIDNLYNGQCIPNCVIPFSFFGPDQTLTLSSLTLNYKYSGASGGTSASNLYDLSSKEAIINSSNLDFKFEDLGFTVSNITGMQTLRLYFDGQQIVSQAINITKTFDFDINPRFALISEPVSFSATSVGDLSPITSSSWDFGDGSGKVESDNNKATHTYANGGIYNLIVNVEKGGLNSRRSFSIIVGDPATSANVTLTKYKSRILNISSQINTYPSWIGQQLEKNFNLTQINSTLKILSTRFATATNDSDYISIINSLTQLNVPIQIFSSNTGSSIIQSGYDNMNIDYLEQISNTTIKDRDKLKSNIIDWMEKNYNFSIKYEVLSALTDSGASPLITRFVVDIQPTTDLKDARDLVINYPTNSITFKDNYQQSPVGSGTYLPLNGDSKEIEFAISDQVSVSSLGLYLVPEDLSKFNIVIAPPKPYPWNKVIIILIIIFVVFFVIYGILQMWYKRHYESHLFKNSDDLYNLINFIYNSRLANLIDSEIKSKLSKSGWKSEQIIYAFKKIDGRRTGMLEIPLFNIFDNRKTKGEIAKRHPEGVDARFIKRPRE